MWISWMWIRFRRFALPWFTAHCCRCIVQIPCLGNKRTPGTDKLHEAVGGTKEMKRIDEKYHVPQTMVSNILHLYHDMPKSCRQDGFWSTYNKLLKQFTWPVMKDIRNYVWACHSCQVNKVWSSDRRHTMKILQHSQVPCEVVHFDFANLRKAGEGVRKTQAFLLPMNAPECHG